MIDEKANLRSNTGHHEASGGKVLAKRLKKIQFPSIIVGIGASAGGLSALRKLLANLGDVSNITFILIQHLNESGAALAHGVLQTLTGLEVLEIRDGISIRPGVLYHSPSHVNITLHKGILKVDAIAPTADQISNIDTFFQSLADDQGEKSIGVLLSGVGSDGTAGLKAISDAGGLTIVQSPESAEFPPMPENAIATGVIDHILLPEAIPAQVMSYAEYLRQLLMGDNSVFIQEEIKSALNEICKILHKATRHDFKHYKTNTLIRRTQRRMQVLQLVSVAKYITRLQSDSKEIDALFKELLINVTCFFRDPEAFVTLKENVFAKALKGRKPDQKYRVWVAGCSTGEEVYSIAILIREILAKIANPPEVQIIATDIDQGALNVARRGVYSVAIADHVSPARLKKFFTKKGGRYAVSKELREIVLFSSHNLINDPPFSQLDLISCRNVMIYLGSHLQKKLIPVFHYALRPGGFLFLGSSETLTGHKELFRNVSVKYRIGQRKATAIRPPGFSAPLPSSYVAHPIENARNHEADLHLVSQRIILDEFAPKYAIVNDDCQIVSVSSGLAQYLDPAEGTFQNNIIKLVKPSLRAGLRSAFAEASKHKRRVLHQDSTLKIEKEMARIGITVQPMPQLGDETGLYMVVFHYFGTLYAPKNKKKSPTTSTLDTSIVDQLERELATLREDLLRSVQDLEAPNEELKSSNEELLSMNEELQSANEELETSKEDVQSANDALMRGHTDLENLLASTEIATLFLDDAMRIQNFTRQLENIYNISSVDLGRPISDLTNLVRDMPPYPDISEVLNRGGMVENDMQLRDGRWILRRISPYRTSEGTVSGIVVTFIDVTHLRMAEERYKQLADSMPHIIWTADAGGLVNYYNERWYKFTGFSSGETLDWKQILHPDDRDVCESRWRECVETGRAFEIECRLLDRKNSHYRWFLGRAVPQKGSDGETVKWYGSCVDIDDRVLAEQRRRETEERFRNMADSAPVLIWVSDIEMRCSWFNKTWLDWRGRTLEQELGDGWLEGVHPEDLERCERLYKESFAARKEFYTEYRMRHSTGEYRWLSDRGIPRFTPDGTFEGYIGGCMDIDIQKIAQERLLENEERLEMMIRTSPSFMCLLQGPDYVFAQANDRYLQLVGHRNIIGKTVREALPEIEEQGFLQLLDRVRATGEPFVGSEISVMLERSPGAGVEQRFLDFVYQPDERMGGQVHQIFVHGNDVTEKVLARHSIESSKAAIENERENFRNLFKQTPEMVCILSGPEHIFEFVNEAHIKVLGFDATGMTVRKAQPESVEVHGILDEVYRTGITAELHEIPVTVGDRLRYFNLTYAAKRDLRGRIDGVMILGTEITNEITSRAELQFTKESAERARLAAEAANESKTRFLANMSHEIRTPLAAILGFSELLQGKTRENDPDAATQLDRISKNAAQLGRLIDELLDLSKIEAERLEIEMIDFDLQSAIDDALASLSLMARQKGLVVQKRMEGEIPKVVRTDQIRFRQILTNIVGNAIKFTDRGRVDVEIKKIERDEKSFLEIRVIDTGIGVSPQQQRKLFEPFTQADTSVSRKYGGTGLGLVLARRLSRLLGGDLVIEKSALGQGSTFLITIEVGIAPSVSVLESRPPQRERKDLSLDRNALKNRCILVVDDSADNQTIISLYLHAAGGEVEIANNGLEAVEKMKRRSYDVVLMDIQMSVMDGYQALDVATANGYRGPILALTAHAMTEERDRCLAAGFTSYLSKPVDRRLLIERLVEVIESRPIDS